jgi:hypothetical protein
MQISKEKAQEILKKYSETDKQGYKPNTDLFNWCEEYKDFINNCVSGCISMEVEYILKKSYEDSEAPLSYEDLDLFDIDKAREHLLYKFDENQEEYIKIANDPDNFNRRVKNKSDFEVFLNSLSKDELKDLFGDLNEDTAEAEAEVYEWWIIQDPLKYRLEQEGEIFLKGGCVDIWGRCTSGQSISLDSCCINAFINLLKDIVR